MALATVQEEEAKYRGPVPADHSSEGNHHQRVADAQEEDRQRNLARQTGHPEEAPYLADAPRARTMGEEATAIAYSWGVAAAQPFILRTLADRELLVKAIHEIAELKDEVADLRRKKGYPLKVETRGPAPVLATK